MCQATVYLAEEEIAREVTGVTPVEDGVKLTSFFEDPRIIPARILHIDLLKHRVQLEPLDAEE
jgi:predicted RNA-binding protein